MALSPATRLGPVHLVVTDVERSSAFYADAIGLRGHRRENGMAALGAGGEDLLVLHEERGAAPPGGHSGLYHFALLHPSRRELARAARRLAATGTSIQGASDHGFSEAIYLADPDGIGIELYADRPREVWPDVQDAIPPGGPRPLDLPGLLELADAGDGAADPGLIVGHIHLHVGDLEQALGFYRDVIGFEPMMIIPSAAFVSAGGYHHHLGLNIWRAGAGAAPAGAVGLRRWTVVVPDRGEVERVAERADAAGLEREVTASGFVVSDPWGIPLLVAAEAA